MNAHARFLGVLPFLLALVFAPALAGASLIYTSIGPLQSVQNLIDTSGTITVDGLVFSDFGFDATTMNGGNAPNAASVLVEGVLLNGNYGLRFVGGWSASGSQIVDTLLSFRVSGERDSLTDDHLWMSSGAGAAGGLASIVETLYTEPETEPVGPILSAYASDAATKTVCVGNFGQPYPSLWVRKDINVNGGGNGIASISEFFQTFSSPQVPEPATMLVLAAGASGTLLSRPRRRQRAM